MTKAERRQLMPECTKFLDDMREHFGAPLYIHAQENGHEVEWGSGDVGKPRENVEAK